MQVNQIIETLFFIALLVIFLKAVASVFKTNDKSKKITIATRQPYKPPTQQDLNLCNEIQIQLKNNPQPYKTKNQRQKRKQKHHINIY